MFNSTKLNINDSIRENVSKKLGIILDFVTFKMIMITLLKKNNIFC